MHAYQPERLKQSKSRNLVRLDDLLCHPRLCVGAALSLVLMSVVFVNAVWYQPGKHPAPLFTTRVLDRNDVAKPLKVAARPSQPAVETSAVGTVDNDQSGELLREIQTALSVRGYYDGKLDGLYGSKTKRAITDFQKDHSFAEDGKVSLRLLTQVLLSASSRPKEVPVPKPSELVHQPKKVKTVKLSVKKENEPPQEVDGLVARIQAGLRAYGYDDLVVDGRMGQQTATAIQRFQLDYGMKITGEPSTQVLEKLRDIGAYTQG